MNITFLMVGNTSEAFVNEGYSVFMDRLKHYIKVREIVIPDIKDRKHLNAEQIKEKEAVLILAKLKTSNYSVLLDERGKEFSSVEFAGFLQKTMNAGTRELFFIIGGAYGVADSVKQKTDLTVSLSRMTFTHQFIRLIFAEQLYRAMTILKNEPYHNE
ncbi:MAG: 23S rRNA (pseudouridine(1915)-N(3))-methyltransferase RlmH [Bacteroidota bacterium]